MEEILYCEGGKTLEQVAQRVMDILSLAVFKARLDGALGSLTWFSAKYPSPWQRDWN